METDWRRDVACNSDQRVGCSC